MLMRYAIANVSTTYCPKAIETITVIEAIAIRIKESGIIHRVAL
jgi:hypothetical protein